MNPLWGGLSIASIAGELVTAATNTAMYTYEIAPIATLIESTILKRMAELADFGTSQGTLTTGGSNGNLLGMLCARQAKTPLHLTPGLMVRKWLLSSQKNHIIRLASHPM